MATNYDEFKAKIGQLTDGVQKLPALLADLKTEVKNLTEKVGPDFSAEVAAVDNALAALTQTTQEISDIDELNPDEVIPAPAGEPTQPEGGTQPEGQPSEESAATEGSEAGQTEGAETEVQ